MPRALLPALTFAAPARAGDKAVEAAVVNVMKYLRQHLRYAPDLPAPRGPHVWTGRQALAAGTVNGCVESAKAFFELYRAATPGYKALFIGSFDAVAEGGHAVVEVTGSDGRGRLADAASFERLPGPLRAEKGFAALEALNAALLRARGARATVGTWAAAGTRRRYGR